MKCLMLLLSLTTTTWVFADCNIAFEQPDNGAMSSTFVTYSNYEKMKNILQQKGYTIVDQGQANLELKVHGKWGYACGSGLTFSDYVKVPAAYLVKLSLKNGNTLYEKEGQLERFVIPGPKMAARRALMKAVRGIPECSSL